MAGTCIWHKCTTHHRIHGVAISKCGIWVRRCGLSVGEFLFNLTFVIMSHTVYLRVFIDLNVCSKQILHFKGD